jgi:hypothetical protein
MCLEAINRRETLYDLHPDTVVAAPKSPARGGAQVTFGVMMLPP